MARKNTTTTPPADDAVAPKKTRTPRPVNADFALEIEQGKARIKALATVGKMAVAVDTLDLVALELLAGHILKRKAALTAPPPASVAPAPQSF